MNLQGGFREKHSAQTMPAQMKLNADELEVYADLNCHLGLSAVSAVA